MKIKILIPIYNDWQSVLKLLENINLQIKNLKIEVSIIIINDASTEQRPKIDLELENLQSIDVINMKINKGHARCNATGLKFIYEKEEFDYVIPMDGDGEDRPEELSLFIEKIKSFPKQVVTGNRIKRSEGFIFKVCYILHKYLTLVFTGQNIKFGNYTCLPKYAVNKMVNDGATWSSFSGSLTKLISSRETIASVRGSRYFGPSKMSFINLIMHSLSIIAVFKKTVMARSVIFLFVYFFLIYNSLSFITLIPIFSIIVFIYFIFSLSKRENLDHLNNSLKNIASIEDIS